MDKNVLYLADVIKQTQQEAIDADWEGLPSEHLWAAHRRLLAQQEAGEEWYPLF